MRTAYAFLKSKNKTNAREKKKKKDIPSSFSLYSHPKRPTIYLRVVCCGKTKNLMGRVTFGGFWCFIPPFPFNIWITG